MLMDCSCGNRFSRRSDWVPLPTPGAPTSSTLAAFLSCITAVTPLAAEAEAAKKSNVKRREKEAQRNWVQWRAPRVAEMVARTNEPCAVRIDQPAVPDFKTGSGPDTSRSGIRGCASENGSLAKR